MSQAMTNDDFDLDKFIKVLSMLSAENDNIRAIAARKATDMLRQNGMDWETFAKGKITIVNDPFASISEPPKAAAAAPRPPQYPPQYQPPPPPPPPTRQWYDPAVVEALFDALDLCIGIPGYTQADINAIRNDYHRRGDHKLFPSEYSMLDRMSRMYAPPKPRRRRKP